MGSTNIDELLNDQQETDVVEAPSATEEQEAGQSLDSQESDQQEVRQEKSVPLKALEEERRKRQEYERYLAETQRQNAELVGYLKGYQQQGKAYEPEPVPDFLTENDKWTERLFNSIGAILDTREAQARERADKEWAEKTSELEEDFREDHDDYDELVDGFFKPATTKHPELLHKLRNSANPAKFAYRTAKKLKAESEYGSDPEALEKKIRAKILAELGLDQDKRGSKVRIPESLGESGRGHAGTPTKSPINGQWRARDLY